MILDFLIILVYLIIGVVLSKIYVRCQYHHSDGFDNNFEIGSEVVIITLVWPLGVLIFIIFWFFCFIGMLIKKIV